MTKLNIAAVVLGVVVATYDPRLTVLIVCAAIGYPVASSAFGAWRATRGR